MDSTVAGRQSRMDQPAVSVGKDLDDDDQEKAEGNGEAGRHELIAKVRQRCCSLDQLLYAQRRRIETALRLVFQHPPCEMPHIAWRLLTKQEIHEAPLEIPIIGFAAVPLVPCEAKEIKIEDTEEPARCIDKVGVAVFRTGLGKFQVWNAEHFLEKIPLTALTPRLTNRAGRSRATP